MLLKLKIWPSAKEYIMLHTLSLWFVKDGKMHKYFLWLMSHVSCVKHIKHVFKNSGNYRVTKQGYPMTVFSQMLSNAVLGYLEYF